MDDDAVEIPAQELDELRARASRKAIALIFRGKGGRGLLRARANDRLREKKMFANAGFFASGRGRG